MGKNRKEVAKKIKREKTFQKVQSNHARGDEDRFAGKY
jgi:hypothetical protein